MNIKKLYDELKRDNVPFYIFKSCIIDIIVDSISNFAESRDEDFDMCDINDYLDDSIKMNKRELDDFINNID